MTMGGDLKDRARLARRLVKAAVGRDVSHRTAIDLPVERHGSDDGGWVVYGRPLSSDAVVYSFGVGKDVTFDLSIISKFGVTVHAFDPTPRSVAWIESQRLPDSFRFYRLGIAGYDGEATFKAPENPDHDSYRLVDEAANETDIITANVERLGTIMNRLRHSHVDLLKLDVEGAEYAVISDLLSAHLDIRQILVEFHHRFETIGIEKTNRTVSLLSSSGFDLFCVSPKGEEFSFVRSDII